MLERAVPRPPTLLDALLLADREQAGAPAICDVAQLGADLDLCVVTPSTGLDARIMLTLYGHAVAMLHEQHLNALTRTTERGDDPSVA